MRACLRQWLSTQSMLPLWQGFTKNEIVSCFRIFFFFSSRRRHTRSDRDWSSDVCSSDLSFAVGPVGLLGGQAIHGGIRGHEPFRVGVRGAQFRQQHLSQSGRFLDLTLKEIGRASCRERGEISVVAVSLKKKKRERD